MVSEKPDGGWGWAVVIAAFTINVICDGLRFSYGLLYIEFLHEFNRGSSETSWIGSILVGVSNLAGPIVSAIINKYGCRFTIILGTLVTFTGYFASVFATSIYYLYISYGLIGGIGYVLIVLPWKVMVIQYFEKRKTLAMGISLCGSGVGTILMNPLSKILIDEYAWRGTLLIESAVVLNASICGWAMVSVKETVSHSTSADDLTHNDSLMCVKEPLNDTAEKNSPAVVVDIISKRNNDAMRENTRVSLIRKNKHIDEKGYHVEVTFVQRHSSESDAEVNSLQIADNEVETADSGNTSNAVEYIKMTPKLANHHTNNVSNGCKRAPEMLIEKSKHFFNFTLLKDCGFIVYMLSMLCIISSFMLPYSYLPDMAVAAGITRTDAASVMSAIGIASTACWIVGGIIGDKKWFNRWKVYLSAILMAGVSVCLMPFATHHIYLLTLVAVVFGLCFGMIILSYSLVAAEIFGEENFTDALGLIIVGGGVASLIGPPLAGWLFDSTGTYLYSFVIFGAVFALGGIVLFLVPWLHNK